MKFAVVLVLSLLLLVLAGPKKLVSIGEQNSLSHSGLDCEDSGWRWGYGPRRTDLEKRISAQLATWVSSSVVVREFGEYHPCGQFKRYSFNVSVSVDDSIPRNSYEEKARVVRDVVLAQLREDRVDIRLILPDGTVHRFPETSDFSSEQFPEEERSSSLARAEGNFKLFLPILRKSTFAGPYTKKVYVIVYDPLLSNGKLLSEHLGWREHGYLTRETIRFFRETSRGYVNYQVVYTTVVTSGWPVKIDGYRYTEQEYLDVYYGRRPPHNPDTVNYNAIVNDPQFDICGKANRGEIDEVWIYNGPWFGFYESTLVGPGAYWFNSPPVPGPHSCQRLIPIMGPSPETVFDNAIHNFGHRMESTMRRVYGSWYQNRVAHNWERFALVKHLSPSFWYSGCGNIHYPPNGVSDYDYSNYQFTPSICADFVNYPNLNPPEIAALPTSCTRWGCTHLGFLRYWFSSLPSNQGCGPDGVANNWWIYFANPELALNPGLACR